MKAISELTNNFATTTGEILFENDCLFLITIEIRSNEYKSVLSQFQNGNIQLELHLSTLSSSLMVNDKENIEIFKQEMPQNIDLFQNFKDNCKSKLYSIKIKY